jgi:aminoglycoside phosphotransferase (APT) family kinase protein
LDPEAVLSLVADPVGRWAGFVPARCRIEVLKRTDRRIVARYDLGGASESASLVGKWYSTDRGAMVAEELAWLRNGSMGGLHTVPAPVHYQPDARVLFVEAIEGTILREEIRRDQGAARRAGEWLAAFHRSALPSPRACNPDKQRRAVGRWASEQPALRSLAGELRAALERLPDPEQPVHYDYYHSQILLSGGATVALDLDEAGRGDPTFDLAHFEAHLELLALQWFDDPASLSTAGRAFRQGYEGAGGMADFPERRPALSGFAWIKLAHHRLTRGEEEEGRYALDRARGSLSTA